MTVLDEQGAEQTLTFRHQPKSDGNGPRWRLLTATPEGETRAETATVHGSGIPGLSMLRLHKVTEGLGLVYVVVRQLKVRSIDDLPPDSPWRYFLGEMSDPARLPVQESDEYIRRELMAYDQDGALYWSIPDGTEITTGPIVRAEIIPPESDYTAAG